jgi:RNA polymerase sigma-70 factor (ECF subfamily)
MTFRQLYDEQFRFVWRSLRRIGVAESDVADAVQDVFVVVHRKLGDFEGKAKVTTWLFGICVRVASDRRRLAHTRRELPTENVEIARLDADAAVGGPSDARDARALLETILDRMSDEQRIVFTLFELQGLTGEEIADLLDVPLGTVRSRLRLARECFQRCVTRLRRREASRTGVALTPREA